LLVLFCICGCEASVGYIGSNSGNKITASYYLFSGTKTATIDVVAGKTLVVNYKSQVKQGELTIKLFDSEKKLVAELETNTTGTKTIKTAFSEKYELNITGTNTEGSFTVDWEVK
jgi:thymidine phosphorylase